MKLSSAGAKGARVDLRERQKRDRAAAPAMRTVFPQIKSLRLNFAFVDDVTPLPAPQSYVLHPPASAYFIFPCPYFDCDGHFDLSPPVNALMGARGTQEQGHLNCCGSRSRDKTGRSPCKLQLDYTLEVLRD